MADRECRFRKQEARRGKTRRRHLLFTAMALGPGVVLAEGVGSAFCPLTPSRRLRLFAPPALPVTHARAYSASTHITQHGEAGLLKRTIASDATYSVAGNRVASVGTAASWAKRARIAYAAAGRKVRFPASSSWFAEATLLRRVSIGAHCTSNLNAKRECETRAANMNRTLTWSVEPEHGTWNCKGNLEPKTFRIPECQQPSVSSCR